MPFKITNVSKLTFKQPVPLNILFDDGYKTIKHVIQPDESIVLHFLPSSVRQLEVRNMVTVEFVTNDSLIKPIVKPLPVDDEPIIVIESIINDEPKEVISVVDIEGTPDSIENVTKKIKKS